MNPTTLDCREVTPPVTAVVLHSATKPTAGGVMVNLFSYLIMNLQLSAIAFSCKFNRLACVGTFCFDTQNDIF